MWSVFTEVVMTSWINLSSYSQVSQTHCLCLLGISVFPCNLLTPLCSLSLFLAPSCAITCSPFTTEQSARCDVVVGVCVCVNETGKFALATPHTPNQTWQTHEMCMLSSLFHSLLAVAFCSFSRKLHFTVTAYSMLLHILTVYRASSVAYLHSRQMEQYLHVMVLIFDCFKYLTWIFFIWEMISTVITVKWKCRQWRFLWNSDGFQFLNTCI